MTEPRDRRQGTAPGMLRAWLALTHDEQRAMLLVLGLLILGLTVWAFRRGGSREQGTPRSPAPTLPESRPHSP